MSEPKENKKAFWLFSRFSRSKESVSAAASVMGTLGAVGKLSLSDNSAATSKNLQAASIKLGEYLETQDQDDDGVEDVVSMSRWVEKTELYPNSSYGVGKLEEASIPHFHRNLINLAAISSKEVYAKRENLKMVKSSKFAATGPPALELPAELFGGSIKATSIRLYEVDSEQGSRVPVVVVAVRGTASIHDWMSAQRAADKVGGKIRELILSMESSRAPHLLLTGHSAGGAVAALLHAHTSHVSTPGANGSSELRNLATKFASVHLVTFGAPPTTSPALPPPKATTNPPAFLGIINEGDPIPRAGKKYINALLQLYVAPAPKPPIAPLDLPEMSLRNAGTVLVLLRKAKPTTSQEVEPVFWRLQASGPGSIDTMLYGDPRVHSMVVYLRKLGLLEK
ncbi:hypothetical protein GP486_004680 [Trichoglossum hirsutum]|uniref:Fungal lipase-type domain-containing protein n=1 Tax=Trichoglossum hirsutum TaxID=265104 RepID=A0A9P8LAF5_9PEZI|nr:hypothetical protein GP486_004680 [Trichoglossum hirsutum]